MIVEGRDITASPGSLIVTFAGLYLRDVGGWIAVADLIALLEPAGHPPTAVRQALVRLKSRGFVSAERRDGRAGYRLTEAGLADLAVGDARIWRFGEADEADGWVLAVFSVPEHNRAERHRLRSQLSFMGFGTVSPGVWIAPAGLAERAARQIDGQGLSQYVTWFTARPVQPADAAAWWDLDVLARDYAEFLARWPIPGNGESDSGDDDRRSEFVKYLLLVDDWRRFPRIDPGLPAVPLPADWPGRRAFQVFNELRQEWSASAAAFVNARVLK